MVCACMQVKCARALVTILYVAAPIMYIAAHVARKYSIGAGDISHRSYQLAESGR